jgi:phage terminase large subunit
MEMNQRLTSIAIDTGIPVMITWDLGLNDATSIWFVQVVGREIRFVDYYENSGFGLEHDVQELKKRREQHGFVFGEHYFPHNVNNGEISNGKSRFDTLVGLGITPIAVPRVQNVNDGINAVRRQLAQSRIDPICCERGLKCPRNYRKEWDEDRATFRDKPFHNWASHGADSLRNFAQGFVEPEIVRPRGRYRTKPGGGGSWQSA